MIVEIGTSDFRTQAGKEDGLFIEPIEYYFDRLPKCNKENVAISDFEGEISVFYLTDKDMDAFGLPYWVRGCNSIGTPHPSIVSLLNSKKIDLGVIRTSIVPVVRIASLIDKYSITHIDTLKIDTEGHDCVILNDYLDTVQIKPSLIVFESNALSDKDEVVAAKKRLTDLGYQCAQERFDMVCRLS